MNDTIIDAHAHLWLRQDTVVNDLPIRTLENGRSLFMGEIPVSYTHLTLPTTERV